MKIIFELALSYLKNQKGKTVSLITSIALAVILVFTLNVIPETQSELNIKEAYKNFSDYHVEYTNLNKDMIEKLNTDKDVREIENTLNLGNIVDKNGASISLNSYNGRFIEGYGYSFIKGNNPKNETEIVLEEKALKEMGLSNELNQIIDFTVIKKYLDENSNNQIYSKNIKLKLVGIVQKPDNYYEGNLYYKVKGFVGATENNNILPRELVKNNGILKFKGKNPNISLAYKKIGEYKLNEEDFMVNVSLTQVLDEYSSSKTTKFSINNKLIPMIAAGLVIYNIFNIILIDMNKQIGMLRAIGLSKRRVKHMLLIQGLVVTIIGITIGIILGGLFSKVGISLIYGRIIKIYISKISVIEPVIMAIAAVVLSMIFIIYKSGKISPIEAIRFTSNPNKRNKGRFHYKKANNDLDITSKMAFKNLNISKSRTILSVLSIGLAGILFISKMAVYNNDQVDDTSMLIMTMGKSDIVLDKDLRNTDANFNFYNEEDIKKISKIKEVTYIDKSINLDGYLITSNNRLNEEYKQMSRLDKNKNEVELELKIKGYDDKGMQSLGNFIESGNNICEDDNREYPNALISNYYYSLQRDSNDAKVLNNIKVGDLIDIKIPVKENDKIKYKDQKVRVSGILNKNYVVKHNGGMDASIQVMLSDKDLKNITSAGGYNSIAMSIEENSDKKVIKQIKEITKKSSFVDLKSKDGNRAYFIEQDMKSKKEVLVSVILTLLISSINLICIIRTNIMIRLSEISTLRAIGMSIKKVKNMIIKESLIYGILSIVIASIFSTVDYFNFIKMVNQTQENMFSNKKVAIFNIPFIEIMQFATVTVVICLVAVYLSKNIIEKLSIVDGIKDNE